MKYFGTDGFRGKANERLTAIHAFRVGRFLGRYHARGRGERVRIAVGKDTRRSSYALEYSLAAGAAASGADVYLLHVTTTPSVAYLVRTEGFDSGVMISASHNLFEDNGIKLFGADGEKLPADVLSRVEAYLDGGTLPLATGADIGRTVDYVAGRNRYLAYLLSIPRTSFRGLRVGLDCANGSAFAIAKAVFDALGAEVVCVGVSPDGTNINAGCGSTHPETLRALVTEHALDVGFAFDGDADRCICVDERGEIVDGDGILYLAAKYMKARGDLRLEKTVAEGYWTTTEHGYTQEDTLQFYEERCIMIKYLVKDNTNNTIKAWKSPNPADNHIIATLHCYEPGDFCIWGNRKAYDAKYTQNRLDQLFLF